ncbi:uncharacterized protein LOC124935446 [Impatiens glandulifera]|uniref:uncharacterized protein LOC124935446 n=1 Tax=Impatiens glandulifera TaxID=253017 RepID=UPI001FB125FC|nr:uncharacterized protein LOC124935446 [Impatiens glandulifera]
MARIVVLFLFLSALLISSWIPISLCEKPTGSARKEDIPFIKCEVCAALAYQTHQQVEEKRTQILPKKVMEYDIIEILEGVCNLKKPSADWILYLDIIELEDRLKLVLQDTEGQCQSKCKTIEKACQEVLGNYDTDIAEYIYKSKPNFELLFDFLCQDLTYACTFPPPPVPKDRVQGEPFVRKTSKEIEIDRKIKSMEDMPGAHNLKLYSREDLLKGKYDNEDEDDDDDDGDFPSRWSKEMKKKKLSLSEKISESEL